MVLKPCNNGDKLPIPQLVSLPDFSHPQYFRLFPDLTSDQTPSTMCMGHQYLSLEGQAPWSLVLARTLTLFQATRTSPLEFSS